MRGLYFSPDFPDESSERRDNFAARARDTRDSFAADEEDHDQQEANIAMSGPGRSHFLPSDRETSSSCYILHDGEHLIDACQSAIKGYQAMYKIDPLFVRVSYTMYFQLSEKLSHDVNFQNGIVPFYGISGDIMTASVKVHKDADIDDNTVIDVIICTN